MGSYDFLRSCICLGLSLRLDHLEQIQEEGRRWFRENGARSRPLSQPKWSSISASVSAGGGFLFFLFFFCFWVVGFDNDLIMVGLWVVACGGYGLWAWWWWCGWQRFMGFKFFFFLVVGFI